MLAYESQKSKVSIPLFSCACLSTRKSWVTQTAYIAIIFRVSPEMDAYRSATRWKVKAHHSPVGLTFPLLSYSQYTTQNALHSFMKKASLSPSHFVGWLFWTGHREVLVWADMEPQLLKLGLLGNNNISFMCASNRILLFTRYTLPWVRCRHMSTVVLDRWI